MRAAVPVIVAFACGGRTTLLPYERGGLESSPMDASADGQDGALPDGAPTDERGPTPVPVCTGELSQCVQADAGFGMFGASVIQCQPEEYEGPWTLVLQRLSGASWRTLQTQVVQEPGFGATFYDSSGPPTVLTYRVCAVANSTTALCGNAFTTQGPPDCACLPTTCALNTACNTDIDNLCGSVDMCGACTNGMACNELNTCCPPGFMSDGNGGCVCAPPPPVMGKGCPSWMWNTSTCRCTMGGM